LLAACLGFWWWRGTHPLQARLERVAFAQLPGWDKSDSGAALQSFHRACAVLAHRDPGDSMGYAGTAGDWQAACNSAAGDSRHFFESQFTPYRITGAALFTGYYEPQISGSHSRHGAFQTPVYGLPTDLVSADLGAFIPKLKGEHIAGRLEDQKLVPYASRAEIDANGLSTAPILFWCDDPVALFFLQIQGSGRVRFDDGGMARVAFAGVNGRAYTAIGRALIEQGALTRENVSLSTIKAWLYAHPQLARAVMEVDQSYVFFQEAPIGDAQLGSPGTLGVALTPLASLAVDARIHPLGAPFFVVAKGPDAISTLMVAQDTGGAIRGAARADLFFGFGAKAESRAGAMKENGSLYVLLPNAVAARLGAETMLP
jgi:membrane-bound lytic murein transglycosylase A